MNKAYRDFFIESDAGQEFMTKLHALIEEEHKKGENTNDQQECFAHNQRANGIRQVLSTISDLTNKPYKGKYTDK